MGLGLGLGLGVGVLPLTERTFLVLDEEGGVDALWVVKALSRDHHETHAWVRLVSA